MKEKLFVSLIALLMVASAPGASFSQDAAMNNTGLALKAGVDLNGDYDSDVGSGDVDMGFSLAAEYLFPLGIVNVGPGLAWLIPRGIDEEGATGKIGFLPVYAAVNVPLHIQGRILPFFFGRIGYSFLTDDSAIIDGLEKEPTVTNPEAEGGIYWGIGGGVLLANRILFELCYASHTVTATADCAGCEKSEDAEYTYVNLSVGYLF